MRLLLITSILLCLASCGFFSERQRQINFLYENSKLTDLDSVEIQKFDEKKAGLIEVNMVEAIYAVPNLDKVLLRSSLTALGYRKLPASDLVWENSFDGEIQSTDQGYYLIRENSEKNIELLVILNFTRSKIIIYKVT